MVRHLSHSTVDVEYSINIFSKGGDHVFVPFSCIFFMCIPDFTGRAIGDFDDRHGFVSLWLRSYGRKER